MGKRTQQLAAQNTTYLVLGVSVFVLLSLSYLTVMHSWNHFPPALGKAINNAFSFNNNINWNGQPGSRDGALSFIEFMASSSTGDNWLARHPPGRRDYDRLVQTIEDYVAAFAA
jgi:hypothetical protein